jgi:hypothetical protein
MGILGKLFGKKGHDQRTQLEATLDKLTPGFMREQSHKLPNDLKVPYAQAMSVLLFAQLFARSWRGNYLNQRARSGHTHTTRSWSKRRRSTTSL